MIKLDKSEILFLTMYEDENGVINFLNVKELGVLSFHNNINFFNTFEEPISLCKLKLEITWNNY